MKNTDIMLTLRNSKNKSFPPTKKTSHCIRFSQQDINNKKTWEKIKDQIMYIENTLFDKHLRETEDDYKKTFLDKDSIFIMYKKKNEIIGYMCGGDIKKYIFTGDRDYSKRIENEDTCYIETINVHPNFQHKGYGTKLFNQFISQAKEKCYNYISGHFCKESSKIAFKFNGKIISTHKNYSGTNKTYYYVVIKI